VLQRALQREHGAGALGVAEVGEHERVAVDDAGGRRVQRRDRAQLRLHAAHFAEADRGHVGDAIGMRLAADPLQLLELRVLGGDDQLAAAAVRHAALGAVGVQALAPRDAGARLERALRVIDAGMDHLGVARAGMRADRVLGFDDHDLAPGERERARHREAHQPRADHDRVNAIHAGIPFPGRRRRIPRPRRPWPWAARCRRTRRPARR
jgi:hypothetical protein